MRVNCNIILYIIHILPVLFENIRTSSEVLLGGIYNIF